MGSSHIAKITVAAAVLCGVTCDRLAAANPATAPLVTYTASGKFATPALSGTDIFQLAGQPFNLSMSVSAALPPTSHGPQYAEYTKLKVTGQISSGLIPTPYPISTNMANLELATGNPSYDVFTLGAPLRVISLTVTFIAKIEMPPGTITKPLIHPFSAPVTLSPKNTMVVYSDTSNGSTTLAIASGTLNATIPAAPTAGPQMAAQTAPVLGPGTFILLPMDGLPRKTNLTAVLRSLYRSFWCSGCEG